MMSALAWPRIRTPLLRRSSAHDEGVRRVGARLATQTVALLLVMLLTLEVVVYVITEQTLLGALETTLKDRTNVSATFVCAVFHSSCPSPHDAQFGTNLPIGPHPGPQAGAPSPGGGHGDFGGGPGGPGFNPDLNPSDASSVFVDSNLQIVHNDGALGKVLLDPLGARQALSGKGQQSFSVQTYKGEDYLVYTEPVMSNARVVGAVQNSISEHQYHATMNALLVALIVVAILGMLTSGGVSFILVRRALSPIRAAIQRQRDFVADAAHELRTPLAIMRTMGEVGMADRSVDDLQATIVQMLGENQHLTRLVEDLSLLARADTDAVTIDRRPIGLSSLVAETASELEPLAHAQGVKLTADVHRHVSVLGDTLRLRQLLLIVLDNALKHTPAGGNVSIRLVLQGERARLQVRDSGSGIAPEDLPHIFDRFYRADRARTREGSGLGLAIGKWIAEAHGGQIQASNASPTGALFTVTLPVMRAQAS